MLLNYIMKRQMQDLTAFLVSGEFCEGYEKEVEKVRESKERCVCEILAYDIETVPL